VTGWRIVAYGLFALIAGCARGRRVEDPVPDVPLSRQRTIARAELGFRWPLTVGVGTLACDDTGAILFRSRGVTYVVSGTRPGALNLVPLRAPEPSPPPSKPLKRLPQAQRMDAFESMQRCESRRTGYEACQRTTLARFGLSREEWALIDGEGRERKWPPLPRGPMSVDPLVAAGRALCVPASGR
jgi:hypothetical protein